MKFLILFCLTLLVTSSLARPLVIDDRALLRSFDKSVAEAKDKGAAAEGPVLQNQLESRSKVKLKLPQVAKTPREGSLYADQCRSVFVISSIYKCDRCDKWHRSGAATAWALTADGVMVSNYHVFDDAKDKGAFGVASVTGEVFPVTEILAANRDSDVAIFRVKGEGFRPLPLRVDAPVGEKINLISHPDGRFFYFTEGRISRYYRLRKRKRDRGVWMHVSLEYAKGSSGGPIFDDQGRVVGIVSSTYSIYYGSKNKKDRGPFQMVVRNCPTAQLIRDLIE